MKNRILHTFSMPLIAVLCSIRLREQVQCSPLPESKEEIYLKRFGYMKPTIVQDGDRRYALLAQAMPQALKRFQRMAGIPESGRMDEDTKRAMDMPRCGMPDVIQERVKRSNFIEKWSKTDLKYYIKNYSRYLPREVVDSEIRRALQVWSEVSPINFDMSADVNSADIEVSFERWEHGDAIDFDGPGGILAHAFYPENGDLHFDDDEHYTSNNSAGTNIFQVAIHEIGHSLGLDHSHEQQSVMAPFYRGYNPDIKLHSEDINNIQSAYGKRETPETTTSFYKHVSTIEPGTMATTIQAGGRVPEAPVKPPIGPRKPRVKKPKPIRKPGKKNKNKHRDSSEEKDGSRKSNRERKHREREEKKKQKEEARRKKAAEKAKRKQEKKKSKTSRTSSSKSKSKPKPSSKRRKNKN